MKTFKLTGFLSVLSVFALALTSCEEFHGPDVTQNPELSGFEEIELSGDLQVQISKGAFEVVVDGPLNDVSDYQFSISGDRLEGKYRHPNRTHDKISISITLPEITYIKMSGKGHTNITGFEDGGNRDMKIKLDGDQFFDAEVDCRDLELKTSGKNDLYLSGQCETADVKISGKTDVEAFDFSIQDCDINLSGQNEVHVTVTAKLTGALSGKSKLVYDGNPAIVAVNVDGGSHINQK
ncbi:MAG TPA: head GIN domain-containing protein [Flavilitoribacter sp.]|nr:head GIN domain-containing protein [Flavilitoribacter sp.]